MHIATLMLDAFDGQLATVTVAGQTFLGVVRIRGAGSGQPVPTFTLFAAGYNTPAFYLAAPGSGSLYAFALLPGTPMEYLRQGDRMRLAGFYKAACGEYGWEFDEHAVLNVVYYLEQNGITLVTQDNLQRAVEVAIAVRKGFYGFLAAIELPAGDAEPTLQ